MKYFFLILLLLVLTVNDGLFAIDYTLKGPGTKNWNSTGSWAPSGIPNSSDNVILASGSGNLNIDLNASCTNFTIQSGYSGTITLGTFALTILGNFLNNGGPNIGSGSILIGGNFTNLNNGWSNTSTTFTFNGTSDQNIYSAIPFASGNSTFGTLIIDKPSGSVTLQSDIIVETAFDPGSGGTLNQNGFKFVVNGVATPFPVELASFSVTIGDNIVTLDWSTATEVNNYGFEVQRSIRTDNWEILGFIEGEGNSNSPKKYSFVDEQVNYGTHYSYRLKQIDTDGSFEYSKVIDVDFNLLNSLALDQNYPNPFNPSTTISFQLPNSGTVSLKLFSLLGEEILTLTSGFREAGIHQINFNPQGLPSGTYIYQLTSSDYVLTKKMILMK